MKPELKKLCGNLRGFSLKDKKLSRKGFRGVSRQVLSAFRKRIRWVYPGGLSFSIFLSRGLGFSRPSSSLFWARTVLRSPVGDMRPLPGLPRGAEDAPRVPRISPEAGLLHSSHSPYFPIFCHAPAPFPETCSRPASGPSSPRHRTTSFRRQKKRRRTPYRKRLLRDVGPRLSWPLNDERLLFRSLSKDNLGIGLLSHVKMRSIMGDEALNFRVRNGIGCTRFSMDTKEISKNI